AALRRDPPLLAEPDDVPVDEEELREAAAVDDGELVREPGRDARRHEPVLLARAVLAERVEIGERGMAPRHREAGQAILADHGAQGTSSARPDRLELERARVGDGARVRERLRVPAEALAQDRLVLEPVLAVRLEPIPRLVERQAALD